MALATRCPNCQVLFRVVADQLKLRGGLVRCGACRHVFDAIGSLTYIEDSATAPPAVTNVRKAAPPTLHAAALATPKLNTPVIDEIAAAPPPAQPSDARKRDFSGPPTLLAPPEERDEEPVRDKAKEREREKEKARAARRASRETRAEGRNDKPADVRADGRVEPRGEPEAPDATVETPPVQPAEGAAEAHAAEPEKVVPPPGPKRRRRRPAQEEMLAGDATQLDADKSDADEPAFLREDANHRQFSVVFGGGSLLLGLLMLIQLAVIFRTELLTRWPQARPVLVQLCGVFGCTVGWPARAELLAVVGTELQAIPGTDVLELTAIVRNRAGFKVALPAIEVTLTDTTNRTLARKVFAPVDYLASAGEPSSRIDEGLAPASDLTIRVAFEARGISAAGFVVYPFYL